MKATLLKPCPFCGHTVLKVCRFGRESWKYVKCEPCGATGPVSIDRFIAVKIWNIRKHIDQAVEKILKEKNK